MKHLNTGWQTAAATAVIVPIWGWLSEHASPITDAWPEQAAVAAVAGLLAALASMVHSWLGGVLGNGGGGPDPPPDGPPPPPHHAMKGGLG